MASSLASTITKIIVMGMIGLGVLALTLMDVRGVMSDGPGVQDAATVNGERITTRDVMRRADSMARQMNVPRDKIDQSGVKQYVLQNMIVEKLTDEALKDMGLRFSDKAVAAELRTMLTDPKNPNADLAQRYEMILRQSGQSRQEFEDGLRQQIARRVVSEALSATMLPDPLLDNAKKARAAERRDIALVTIVPSQLATTDNLPGPDLLEPLYKAGQAEFTVPESRSGRIYALPEDVLKSAAQDGDVQETLLEIEDAFFGGENPEEVAKQYGLSLHKTLKDVKITAEDTFIAALFDLEPGETSSALPLDGDEKGYGFVVLDSVTPAKIKPMEEVRPQLVRLWKQEQARARAKQMAERVIAAEDPLEAADKEGLGIERRSAVPPSEDLARLFDTPALNIAIPLPVQGEDIRLGVVTGIKRAESTWSPSESSVKDFQTAQTQKMDDLFMQLMAPYAAKASIRINEKALAPAPAAPE